MSVQLVAKEGAFATLRLPSTEMRRVSIDCRATLGTVGNSEADPRCGHEPCGPPTWWRRRQDLGWTPPGVPVGPAGGPHPGTQQGFRQDDRPQAPHTRCPAVGKTEGTSHYAP
jgi:large subunit ribosomal protein L2